MFSLMTKIIILNGDILFSNTIIFAKATKRCYQHICTSDPAFSNMLDEIIKKIKSYEK